MSKYASQTSVSAEKTRVEIEQTLKRYGASSFALAWNEERGETRAMIAFEMNGRRLRFILKLPRLEEFARTPKSRELRSENAKTKAWEQGCHQRWRALLLIIKAKLESVSSGVYTFDQAFLPDVMLPSGQTFEEWASPQIEIIYNSGQMPPLLPALGDGVRDE